MQVEQLEKITIPKKILTKAKIAIVRSEFNGLLTQRLEDECVRTLLAAGLKMRQIALFSVPGSLEIPIMAQNIAKFEKPDVIIALGVIIKGDTYHFELVADNCARGCMEVSLKFNIPVIFGVIAAYNLAQAKKRAGHDVNNKGREAAQAALLILKTITRIGSS